MLKHTMFETDGHICVMVPTHVCTFWLCLLALRRDAVAFADSEINHLQAFFVLIFLRACTSLDDWCLEAEKRTRAA